MTNAVKELNKKSAEKIMEMKGQARGIHFHNDADYVLAEKGKKGIQKVEKKLKELGFPIKYKEIRNLEFYPSGLRALSFLTILKVFGWEKDEEIRKMCAFAAKTSLITRLYIKFFYSVDKLLGKASAIWNEYWTEGKLIVEEYNEKEKRAIVRIEGLNISPEYCCCLEGYIEALARMAIKSKKIECRETVCVFKKGKYHRFKIIWE